MRTSFMKLALAKLLKGEIELLQDLDRSFFQNKEAKIYDLILEQYAETQKLPSRVTISALIEQRAPVNARGPFQAFVEGLPEDTDEISNEELIDGLKGARTLRAVDDRIEQLVEAQRERDFDTVKSILADTLEEVSLGGVNVDSLSDVMDNDEIIHSVPSGFGEDFDELLGNRFAGVTLITAASGGGKSAILLASAIEAFKEGQTVLFVSLELSAKALGARLKAYVCDIDFSRIIKGTTTAEENKIIAVKMREFWGDRKDEFKIVTEQVDDRELLALVAVQAQTSNVTAVYVDYLGLISSAAAADSWKTLSNLVKALHKMSITHGIVVVTAAQIAEAKIEGNTVSLTSRGSAELVFSSSVVLYLKKMEEDGETDAFIVYQAKNRYAKLVHSIVEGQLQYMKFKPTGIQLNA